MLGCDWDVDQVEDMECMFCSSQTASGAFSTMFLADVLNKLTKNTYKTDFTGLEDEFYSKALDIFSQMQGGSALGLPEEQAKVAVEQQLNAETEKAEPVWMQLKALNLNGWNISSTTAFSSESSMGVETTFFGCKDLTTLIAPTTCAQEIALPVTMYDNEGNEYTTLSNATDGNKFLTSSLPAAGFDGLELLATTSVGLVALLAVGY